MPITQAFLNIAANTSFSNAAGIDNFFTKGNAHDFIGWFNTNVGGKGFWGSSGKRAAITMANDSHAHDRFNQLWSGEGINAMVGQNSISLLQFIALQSIINNETGGSLLPLTERVGNATHPGIAYAFDRIQGLKKSYNTLTGNKTCFELFNNADYNAGFQNLPLGNQLKNTTNNAWAGEAYPTNIPSSTNPTVTGYVLEADFFKFRGRGYIQTTGRANYNQLVDFVVNYNGANATVNSLKAKWKPRAAQPNVIATISTNAEWDNLFQNSGTLIPARSIAIHNMSAGNYLGGINGTKPATANSTIRNVGRKISGSDVYADLYINRVTQIIDLLS